MEKIKNINEEEIIYSRIKKELYSRKFEYSFSPSILKKLTDEQRDEVEQELVDMCLNGNNYVFKFIPFMKKENVIKLYDEANLQMMSNAEKCKFYGYLIKASKETALFSTIIRIIANDPSCISVLGQLYILLDEKYDVFRMYEKIYYAVPSEDKINVLRSLCFLISIFPDNNFYKQEDFNNFMTNEHHEMEELIVINK